MTIGTVFVIYALIALGPDAGPRHTQEFQVSQRSLTCEAYFPYPCPLKSRTFFHSLAVCERYRDKIVEEWSAGPMVPFHPDDVVMSRCAPWGPDPHAGENI